MYQPAPRTETQNQPAIAADHITRLDLLLQFCRVLAYLLVAVTVSDSYHRHLG
jgi:hypothetical protein